MTALVTFRDRLARINKHVINPLTLSFAGRPGVPYGIIQHIGRRTGERYTTPVLVGVTSNAFYIPLPYGNTTDWASNIRVEGGGLVVYRGEAYRIVDPRIIDANAAGDSFPGWVKVLLGGVGTTHYLQVRRAASSPEPHTVYERVTADYPVTTGLSMVAGLLLLTLGVAWLVWRLLKMHES